MKKKTQVELGIIAGCAVLLGGASMLAKNSTPDNQPVSNIPIVETVSSIAEQEPEVTVYTTTAVTTTTTETDTATIEETATGTNEAASEEAAPEPAETPAETAPETTAVTTPNERIVYVARSGEGTKYHIRQDCGNMEGIRELTISEAEEQGYTPCKRCF